MSKMWLELETKSIRKSRVSVVGVDTRKTMGDAIYETYIVVEGKTEIILSTKDKGEADDKAEDIKRRVYL